MYNPSDISGSQFNMPKLFSMTQSDDFNNKKAKTKLIMMVVNVKNKFGSA
jgi:hypothetical protein